MGFSSGEFTTVDGRELHFEHTGGRIVLWNATESEMLVQLSPDEAAKAAAQLQLLVDLATLNTAPRLTIEWIKPTGGSAWFEQGVDPNVGPTALAGLWTRA